MGDLGSFRKILGTKLYLPKLSGVEKKILLVGGVGGSRAVNLTLLIITTLKNTFGKYFCKIIYFLLEELVGAGQVLVEAAMAVELLLLVVHLCIFRFEHLHIYILRDLRAPSYIYTMFFGSF